MRSSAVFSASAHKTEATALASHRWFFQKPTIYCKYRPREVRHSKEYDFSEICRKNRRLLNWFPKGAFRALKEFDAGVRARKRIAVRYIDEVFHRVDRLGTSDRRAGCLSPESVVFDRGVLNLRMTARHRA